MEYIFFPFPLATFTYWHLNFGGFFSPLTILGLNPGPCSCQASVQLLSYIPSPDIQAFQVNYIGGNFLLSDSPSSLWAPWRHSHVFTFSVCLTPYQPLASEGSCANDGWTELNWLSKLATMPPILRTLHIWPTSNLPTTASSKAGTFLPDESPLFHCRKLFS